jgi:hypothetical protein
MKGEMKWSEFSFACLGCYQRSRFVEVLFLPQSLSPEPEVLASLSGKLMMLFELIRESSKLCSRRRIATGPGERDLCEFLR